MARQSSWAWTATPISMPCIPVKHNEEVQLCAFDVLAMDGDDLQDLPLSMRKANLARTPGEFTAVRTGPDRLLAGEFG